MDTTEILDSHLNDPADNGHIEINLVNRFQFTLLYILSFALYGIWWQYKSWKFYRDYKAEDIMPAPRAIFALFFIYGLFTRNQAYANEHDYTKSFSPGLLFAGYIFVNLAGNVSDAVALLSIIGFLFLVLPMEALNHAIDEDPLFEAKFRSGFSGRQIALMVVGGLLWILVLIGLFMPEEVVVY